MKFVIQRVTQASVTVDNEMIGKVGKGFLVLIGISNTDTKEIAVNFTIYSLCRLQKGKQTFLY